MKLKTSDDIRFKDRKDAAEQLALQLKEFEKRDDVLILGILKGGVEIARYVAERLGCKWTVVVSKKLTWPGFEEYGFGAVAEEDSIYLPAGKRLFTEDVVQNILQKQKAEITKRVEQFRFGVSLPPMKGKTVIIVDEGIATGVTFIPVIRLCRNKEAEEIIVASPVAGSTYDVHLNEADEVRVVAQPDIFYSVGQVYASLPRQTEEELLQFINEPGFVPGVARRAV